MGIIRRIFRNAMSEKQLAVIRTRGNLGRYIRLYKEIERNERPACYVIGTPTHSNLGDHLIAKAELALLRKLFPTDYIAEIPMYIDPMFRDLLAKKLKPSDRVIISGGGWMGDVWPEHEMVLQEYVNLFRQYKLIIMPQTIFYDGGNPNSSSILKSSRETLLKCKDLTLFVRDEPSYNIAINDLRVEANLVPDIALYLYADTAKKPSAKRSSRVAFCIRGDRESIASADAVKAVAEDVKRAGLDIAYTDTMFEAPVSPFRRDDILQKKICEISDYKLVITDRLHGMILAYLAGTPCVAFDNSTGKVAGVYTAWLNDCAGIKLVAEKYDPVRFATFYQSLDRLIDSSQESNLCRVGIETIKERVLHG